MMKLKDSQLLMLDHSRAKVQLLRLYLEKYLNILNLSTFVNEIFIFDLFCGEGVYNDGGKGSPIIILETINDIHFSNIDQRRKTGKFHCYFNDIDTSKIEKLQNEINGALLHTQDIGCLEITNLDYREILPKVISRLSYLQNQKAFVFIDPYGYKDIKANDIKALLKSRNSEVLLFLPAQFMFRFENRGTPECLTSLIEELVPVNEWPKSQTSIEFIDNLKDKFKKFLKGDHFVDSFIITRSTNQFFCLFFFTSHIYGFEKMLEAKWQLDEEEGRGWRDIDTTNLFYHLETSPNCYSLERELKNYLTNYRTNIDLYEFVLHLGYLPKHCSGILKRWYNEQKLEIISSNKTKKGSFYINYEHFKGRSNKISIKLK